MFLIIIVTKNFYIMYAKLLNKLLFMSRYAALGLIAQCLLFTVILAEDGKAQSVSLENIYVSLKLNNTSIEEAFTKIENSTEFSFAYKKKIIKQAKKQFLKSHFSNESVAGVFGEGPVCGGTSGSLDSGRRNGAFA